MMVGDGCSRLKYNTHILYRNNAPSSVECPNNFKIISAIRTITPISLPWRKELSSPATRVSSNNLCSTYADEPISTLHSPQSKRYYSEWAPWKSNRYNLPLKHCHLHKDFYPRQNSILQVGFSITFKIPSQWQNKNTIIWQESILN